MYGIYFSVNNKSKVFWKLVQEVNKKCLAAVNKVTFRENGLENVRKETPCLLLGLGTNQFLLLVLCCSQRY